MKYIKKFDRHADYEAYINGGGGVVLPNVSYCVDLNEVHFNKFRDTRLVAKFNVTSTSEPTLIADSQTQIDTVFSAIEIDGVNMETMSSSYTFSRTGEHIIKYTLVDPTTVGEYTFYDVDSITSVIFPNSVISVGEGVFQDCNGLLSVVMPNTLTSISNFMFHDCQSLTEIAIPNSVTTIGDMAFADCFSLVSVNIPNSVTQIGENVFNQCNALSTITIGTGVTQIAKNAFSIGSNSNLASVTSLSTTPATLTGAQDETHLSRWSFNDTNDCPIYVPSESLADYRKSISAGGWSITRDTESRFQAIPA